jgi:hypothetical protein
MAKKTAKQLKGLSRWELVNFYHLQVENDTSIFLPTRIWNWAKSYIESRFGGKEDFKSYPQDGDNGIVYLKIITIRPLLPLPQTGQQILLSRQ